MNFPCEDEFKSNLKAVCWRDYLENSKKMIPYWIFRGQNYKELTMNCLMSRFERALNSYQISLSDAPRIEELMIRDFRRKYEGIDCEIVSKDSLYCLSLTQHYGCPTRLLDCTYSPYVAAFFAVENMSLEQKGDAFVFCFNHKWINQSAKRNINDDALFKERFDDKKLTNESFIDLYMSQARNSFIVAENPHQLHRRLSIQKGVFIIQGEYHP